ncbi:MAG: nucleotidyltransferase family protein [Clostridia bacterium]|nr:nucleotidyltransferase family protein [Clostridia bacterium]
MINITETMMKLIKYAMCPEGEPPACDLPEEIVAKIYELSKLHDLTHLLTASIEKSKAAQNPALLKAFQKQTLMSVYRYERINHEFDRLCRALENAEIPFIPLKGSVLRGYYPEPWMRTSCDIDVFVAPENLEKAITALKDGLGYTDGERCAHDVSLFSKSGDHVELHFELIEDERVNDASNILGRVWEYSHKASGCGYRYEMTDEMFYFYHIAHMIKHFELGGCGVRSFLDLWVMNHRMDFNEQKRNELLEQGGLLAFANASKLLSEVWFGNADHTELTAQMEDYLIDAGVYGNFENRIAVTSAKKGGKFKYMLSRIWVPYERLKYVYPNLENKRILTPFYQIKRWCKVFSKKSRKDLSNEMKLAANQASGKTGQTESLFNELGIKI